jgi:hypothetical protein
MSAHLAVEGLEARGLVGAARSSPQPPLAVARRARLEVAAPTRQHRTKRLMSSVSVLTDCGCLYHCRIHRSLRGPLIASAATSRWKFGAAMSRTQSANAAAEGTTRSPALVPAGTALRRRQRRIGCFRVPMITPQLVRSGTPFCDATCCEARWRACVRRRRAPFFLQSARTGRDPKWKLGKAAWSAEA